ncbi:MAG: hypothetical protein RL441_1680 [Actinomycetota bacterium]
MRRLFALALVVVALAFSGVVAPAQAVTVAVPPTRWQLNHVDDYPATAIATVPYGAGGLNTYWLANGFLYRQWIQPGGQVGPIAYMGEAIQLPGVTSDLEAKVNAAGDTALAYTCADGERPAVCLYIAFASGAYFSQQMMVSNAVEFESAWVGDKFMILASVKTGELNPFDAPRTSLTRVIVDQNKTVYRDSYGAGLIDPSVTQFNASKLSISSIAGSTVFAWESYESAGLTPEYVVRATVITDRIIPGGVVTQKVAPLGAERVRSIGTSWLEGADGLVPTIMWATDSQVLTAAETAPNVWTAGATATLAGQALLTDISVTDQNALYAVIKTRHVTTPVLSSFTLTDSRLPIVEATVLTNAVTVSDLMAYQMPGSNPGVITCTSTGTNLLNIATGATIRAWSAVARCGFIEMRDHAGKWFLWGIGTNYSATQNSPHALMWVDSAAPVDLTPSGGRIVDQDMVAVGGQRAVAYIVRDWVDPVSPTITRDRLLVQAPQLGPNGLATLSNPLKQISKLHLIETADHYAVAIWQESESTLFSTSASEVKASVFDPGTRLWSNPIAAVVAGRPIVTLDAVAEGSAGQGQAGSTLLMTASLGCPACLSSITAVLSFDPNTLTFTALNADPAEGSPALAATQLFNGDTAWIFATESHNFEPWVYVRTSAGTWQPPVQLASTTLASMTTPQIVPLKSDSATGVQAAVVYNEALVGAALGQLQMQRLSISDTGPALGAVVPISSDSRVEGNAIFDNAGSLRFMMKEKVTTGYWHRFVVVTNTDSIDATANMATVDDVGVSATADALGRVTFVWNNTGTVWTWSPMNSWETNSLNLGAASHVQSLEVVADTDGVTVSALWFHELNLSNIADSAIWTLALSTISQGEPAEPQLTTVQYTSMGSASFAFALRDSDPNTRLEYRATAGSQTFVGGVDADGSFGITGLDLSKPLSIDVRVVENYGTVYEYASAWYTSTYPALTVSQVRTFFQGWKNLTTASLAWNSLTISGEPYVYEVTVTQNGKSRTFTTSERTLDVSALDAKKPLTYKVRGSLYGVWGAWSDEASLSAAKAPSAPRSLTVKKSGTKIALQWMDPSTLGTFQWLNYRVEMRIGTGPWKVMTSKVQSKTWALAKPVKGKKYSFRVTLLTLINSPASSVKTLIWKG